MLSEMCSTTLWAHLTFNWKQHFQWKLQARISMIIGYVIESYGFSPMASLWNKIPTWWARGKCFINLELPTAHIKISRGGYRGHKSWLLWCQQQSDSRNKKVEQMRYSPWMAIKILYLHFWAQWNHRSKRHFGISTSPKNYRGAFERREPRRYSSHRNEQTSGIENANEIHHTRR